VETPDEPAPEKSFGNMGEHHWSRARAGQNAEALDYYRERSRAPGVAEGGGPRNMYCMQCDGVIPLDPPPASPPDACPHCGRAIEGEARRYFNWVELDRAPRSDWRALWPFVAGGAALLVLLALAAWVFLRQGGSA
jgi:hypothetical protein